MLHKPSGYICSTKDAGRFWCMTCCLPVSACAPRCFPRSVWLDGDTSGLLLLTDDGALLHRMISPKTHLPKVYEATLVQALRGDEATLFASGTLLLDGDTKPLQPAVLEVLGPCQVRLTLYEGALSPSATNVWCNRKPCQHVASQCYRWLGPGWTSGRAVACA